MRKWGRNGEYMKGIEHNYEALTGLKTGASCEITPEHNPALRGSCRSHPRAKGSGFLATANKQYWYVGVVLISIPIALQPLSFFDTYQHNAPFKTVMDDTARAWAFAQDLCHQGASLSAADYQGCIYTLVGMITCLNLAIKTISVSDLDLADKAYYIRLIQCFEADCYRVPLTSAQSTLIQELFASLYAHLIQTDNAKFSACQYQSSYTYWQYPKKAVHRLQHRMC
jgi:hypothetical protein